MTRVDRDAGMIVLSVRRTRRDLRLSALVLGVGVGLYLLGLSLRDSTAGVRGAGWALAAALMVEVGWILVLVGLLFAAINWWLLRQRVRERGALATDRAAGDMTRNDPRLPTGAMPADRPYVACPNCGRVSPAGKFPECSSCGRPLAR